MNRAAAPLAAGRGLLAFLLLLLALASPARAQSGAIPSLGYPVREVRELRIRPLTPGGLLPVRYGEWWGFADSTGQFVITPALVAGVLFPPVGLLRVDGLLAESAGEAEELRARYQSRGTNLNDYWGDKPAPRAFLNTTGELLRVTADEAAVLLPDGRLRAVPRVEVRAGQLELLDVSNLGLVERLQFGAQLPALITRPLLAGPAELRRLPDPTHQPPGLRHLQGEAARLQATEVVSFDALGAGRYTISRRSRQFTERIIQGHQTRRVQGWEAVGGPVALLNRRGRLLTPFQYAGIGSFRGKLAVMYRYQPDGFGSEYDTTGFMGLLNRRGRVLLPPTYYEVQPLAHQRVMVTSRHRNTSYSYDPGIIKRGMMTARGRWRLPLQPGLSSLDAAGYVRRLRVPTPGDTVVEFLNQKGRPAFPRLPVLRQSSAFAYGRAWVHTDAGPGLLSSAGKWVVRPGQYERLLFMGELYTQAFHAPDQQHPADGEPPFVRTNLHVPHPPSYNENSQPADTAFVVVQQQGRYGLVRLATGQLLVPCRYDEITYWDGRFGCARRAGQDYVLSARTGRELLPGTYIGEWYAFENQPPLLQVYRAPNRWLVADTTGHPVTAELPLGPYSHSFLTPEGLAEVWVAAGTGHPCYTWVVAATGQPLFGPGECPHITYSGATPWFNTRYTNYGGTDKGRLPSGAYVQELPDGSRRLLRFRAGQLVDLTGHAYYGLEPLAGGWHFALNVQEQELLISPTGQEYVAPQDRHWNRRFHQPGLVVPFANGTAAAVEGLYSEPVLDGEEGGLITRGGVELVGTRGRQRRQK